MKALIAWVLFTGSCAWCPASAREPTAKFDREMTQAKAFVPVYF